MPKINFTIQSLHLRVPERYRAQYQKSDGTWGQTYAPEGGMRDCKDTYERLVQAEKDHPGDLNKLDEIIGNLSWTRQTCDSCYKATRDPLAASNINGEYEQAFCLDCLKKGVKLLEKAMKKAKKGG